MLRKTKPVVPPMPPLSGLSIYDEQRYIGRDLGLVGGWGLCPTGSLPSLTLTSRELKPQFISGRSGPAAMRHNLAPR